MTQTIRAHEVLEGDMPSVAPAAFQAALLASLPGLRRQALALTRHQADAADLVQAAVTSALLAHASFIPGTNFHAWTARIARNRFLSNLRRRRETVPVEDLPPAMLGISGGQEERVALLELKRHLARLPADHRVALLLITVKGLSYIEASKLLGTAVGTLKCRVFRARRQLQRWMLDDAEFERVRQARSAPARRRTAVMRRDKPGGAVL